MRVPPPQRPDYRKGVRFYFDFCHKYGHLTGAPANRGPFLDKLASKNQPVAQRSQASAAVELLESAPEPGATRPSPPATPTGSPHAPLNSQPAVLSGYGDRGLRAGAHVPPVPPQTPRPAPPASAPPGTRPASPQPAGTQHQNGPAAPFPGIRSPAAQAARPSVPGRGASWEQEYRDLKAAILGELQTIQRLLGHSDIKTTMFCLQTVPGVTLKEAKSPLDLGR